MTAPRFPSLLVSVPPADQQVPLPGWTWPQAAVEQDARLRTRQRARASSSSRLPPVGSLLVGIRETTVREADTLLTAWAHPLGGVAKRPVDAHGEAVQHPLSGADGGGCQAPQVPAPVDVFGYVSVTVGHPPIKGRTAIRHHLVPVCRHGRERPSRGGLRP